MRNGASAEQLIDRYLADLDRALAGLPADRRHQIVAEVARHIGESRAELDRQDPTAIEALLARVGDPHAIAAEAGAYDAGTRRTRWGDRLVPWILLFGGFVFVVGWLVGAVLLWASPSWRMRDKLIGTLVLPGGLASVFYMLALLPSAVTSCHGSAPVGQHAVLHCTTSGFTLPFPAGIVVLAVLVVAPITSALHLDRARRRSELGGDI